MCQSRPCTCFLLLIYRMLPYFRSSISVFPHTLKFRAFPGIASVVHAFPGREGFECCAPLLFSPTSLLLIQPSTCSPRHCSRHFALKRRWWWRFALAGLELLSSPRCIQYHNLDTRMCAGVFHLGYGQHTPISGSSTSPLLPAATNHWYNCIHYSCGVFI